MKKKTAKVSLKNNIILLLLLGWVVPVLIMAVLLGTYVDAKSYEQASDTAMSSLEKANEIFELELAACETASKNASYYSNIRESYIAYLQEGGTRNFENAVNGFLGSEYKYNSIAKSAILVFPEINQIFYTYNNSADGSYKDISAFLMNTKDGVMEQASTLGTDTAIVAERGRIYMIRNLMMPNYTPYAVLVIEMNPDSLTEGFDSVWGYENATVLLDGSYMMGDSALVNEEDIETVVEQLDAKKKVFVRDHDNSYVAIRRFHYGRTMDTIVKLDNEVLYQRIYTTWLIFGLMLAFMIPLTIVIFRFFRKNVTEPVDVMVHAYDEVANKNYGYQIEKKASSKEFYYMQQSFNDMSTQIQDQFNQIISEEIALRDAKIMALQSQINPHFLNNTFEIINWEARLNGNIKVSKMIEALSTMLEATMNRRGEHLHSLAEELSYVDAYAYIISERLGDKFTYVKEIDENLLNVKVPKLIVQPIVENAVEHGISKVQVGRIHLKLYSEGEFVYIDITNDGELSEEDSAKITRLLNEAIDPEKERSLSLGIRNVNNRLKLIFGEECGLSIRNVDASDTAIDEDFGAKKNGRTISTICIRNQTGQ